MYLFPQVLALTLTLISTFLTSYSFIFLAVNFFSCPKFSTSNIQLKIVSEFRHSLQEVYNGHNGGNLEAATEKAADLLSTFSKIIIENPPALWSMQTRCQHNAVCGFVGVRYSWATMP